MAEVITFPGADKATLLIDREGDRFVLQAVNQPRIRTLPQHFDSIDAAIVAAFAAALKHRQGFAATNDALEWEIERQIGPRP